jgi:hypothetical protein
LILNILLTLIFSLTNIVFEGIWNDIDTNYIRSAIESVDNRFTEEYGISFNTVMKITDISPLIIAHYSSNNIGGIVFSVRKMGYYGFYRDTDEHHCPGEYCYEDCCVNLVLHELGHAFELRILERLGKDYLPYKVLKEYKENHLNFPQYNEGYYSNRWNYRQATYSEDAVTVLREEFADMFIGYITGKWEDSPAGKERERFMDECISNYISLMYNFKHYITVGSRYYLS